MLRLRARRAAVLVLGGDVRRALPEFDALADAYSRTAGADQRPREIADILTRLRIAGADAADEPDPPLRG